MLEPIWTLCPSPCRIPCSVPEEPQESGVCWSSVHDEEKDGAAEGGAGAHGASQRGTVVNSCIPLEGKWVQDTDESVIAAVAALLLHSFITFPYLLVLHSGESLARLPVYHRACRVSFWGKFSWQVVLNSGSKVVVFFPLTSRAVLFVFVFPSPEHWEQVESCASRGPWVVANGRRRAVSPGQSHSPALRRQHPCSLTCCGIIQTAPSYDSWFSVLQIIFVLTLLSINGKWTALI